MLTTCLLYSNQVIHFLFLITTTIERPNIQLFSVKVAVGPTLVIQTV